MTEFKLGDKVRIVKSIVGNEGKEVTLLHYVGEIPGLQGEKLWVCDVLLPTLMLNGPRGRLPEFPYIDESCIELVTEKNGND